MTQEEHDKFSELFSDILMYSGIQYANKPDGEAYVVYNNAGIMFSITHNKLRDSYILGNCYLLKSKYKQYGLSADAVPDHKMVFETVAFAYKTQQTILSAQKDFTVLYKDLLIDSDIVYDIHGSVEIYNVVNDGMPGYTIKYNKKTGEYELKRHELMKTLYAVCGIPSDKKPDYASLYKRTKDACMAQMAVESMNDLEIY